MTLAAGMPTGPSDGAGPAAGPKDPVESLLAFGAWMTRDVLPFWSEYGFDGDSGLFHERLNSDGSPDREAVRRVRVQFRQIHVFSQAAVTGQMPAGSGLALRAWERLVALAWRKDGAPGFAHLIAPDGSVADRRCDAYDHAFAVLAASWLWRATGDPSVSRLLDQVIAFADTALAGSNGALREGVPDGLPWRQNPQMHWFEAMLALTETGARADGAMRAARHRTLFETVLCDPATRILGEYFDADWRPAPGDTGERVEPGHMAEWAWLLRRHEAIAGLERSSLPTVLLANALGYRDGGPGLLVDEGTRAGAILRGTRRIWPQTERVKAHLGEYQAGVPGAAAAAGAALDLLARHYLGRPFAAGWIDQLDVAGVAVPGPVPASILYHLYGIHAEAARWRATGVAG